MNFGKIIGMKNKALFEVKKRSPEILVAVGVIGVGISFVKGCKDTLKAQTIIEEQKIKKEQIKNIKQAADEGKLESNEIDGSVIYTDQDFRKDTTLIAMQTGAKLLNLYAPSIGMLTLSIGCIVVGHNILRKRNIALITAYAGLDKSFKGYRDEVIDRFGEKVDRELRYGIRSEEIEETVVDENGKEKKEKKTEDVIRKDYGMYSPYAKFFDNGNDNWEKSADYNLNFLRRQQAYANDMLRINGYLFLNDVYKMLGFDPTVAGQTIGWLYDKNNPENSFVDFGIYDVTKEKARDFVNGYERTILLDFNVDGYILDKAGLANS